MTALPDVPPRPGAPGTVAVAFCPAPPLLIPDVEGREAPETAELRRACAEALEGLLVQRPAVVVVVGAGVPSGVRYGSGDRGSLRGYGVHLDIPFDGPARPEGRELPLAHTVGAWLLDQAGFSGTRVGVGPEDLAQLIHGLPRPLGVLALGEGSARRTVKAPGYLDDGAAPFDGAAAAAMADGDAAALAEIDLAEGERLLAAGATTWQAVGAALRGREITGRLHLDAVPFGVGYLVADWAAA